MIKVLPSSNPEKEENLVQYVKKISQLGVEYLHCDVMDGCFVENRCLTVEKIREIRNNCNILLDVHLMICKPQKHIKEYMALKPSIITVHYECFKSVRQIKKLSKLVRSKDILFGISIKPKTSTSVLVELIDYIDLVLIMLVEPGKSGQSFIKDSLNKIRDVQILTEGKDIIIEVDGGINLENYKIVINSGAKFLVMGSAFYNEEDKSQLLHQVDKHYLLKEN